MKQPIFTTVLGCLFVTLTGTGYTTHASADAAADCRQEARGYGVSAEELDDYIDGCLASRGELMIEDAASMDYVPPDEMDDLPDPLEDADEDADAPQ